MLAILKREINSFFSTSVGFLVIALFLTLNSLLLWFIPGEFNILDNGFADLSSFFIIVPWIFLFLIPAVTMKAFSEEKKMGTFELLATKPISLKNIVLGKYFGAIILIYLALIPTTIYVITISELTNNSSDWDIGSTDRFIYRFVFFNFSLHRYRYLCINNFKKSNCSFYMFRVSLFIYFLWI